MNLFKNKNNYQVLIDKINYKNEINKYVIFTSSDKKYKNFHRTLILRNNIIYNDSEVVKTKDLKLMNKCKYVYLSDLIDDHRFKKEFNILASKYTWEGNGLYKLIYDNNIIYKSIKKDN